MKKTGDNKEENEEKKQKEDTEIDINAKVYGNALHVSLTFDLSHERGRRSTGEDGVGWGGRGS